ncbi:hypothetical protein GCM10027090_39640 [Sinomonas soli]
MFRASGRTLVPGDEDLPAMPGTPEALAFLAFPAFLARQLAAAQLRVSLRDVPALRTLLAFRALRALFALFAVW